MAISLLMGMNLTKGSLSDLAIQSETFNVSFNRSFAARSATSHALMEDIKISLFFMALSISRFAGIERYSGLLTHHIQT